MSFSIGGWAQEGQAFRNIIKKSSHSLKLIIHILHVPLCSEGEYLKNISRERRGALWNINDCFQGVQKEMKMGREEPCVNLFAHVEVIHQVKWVEQ